MSYRSLSAYLATVGPCNKEPSLVSFIVLGCFIPQPQPSSTTEHLGQSLTIAMQSKPNAFLNLSVWPFSFNRKKNDYHVTFKLTVKGSFILIRKGLPGTG